MMSAGFFLGFQQYRFDVSEVFVEDFNDPALQGSSTSFIFPDITPGIYFYDKSWTFGVAVAHIIGNPIPNLGTTSIAEISGGSRLRRHVSLMASRSFGDEEKFSYTPAILLRFVSASVPAIDLNFIAEYKKRIGLGVSYRNGDALAALMQVRFLKYFSLAYAFDFTTSRIRIASSNTHEITLGISICPRGTEQGRVRCAAYR